MAQPELIIEFAPNDVPMEVTPTWIDITDDVISIPSIRRGRSRNLGPFEAGTATIILDNSLGAYTPGNTESAYTSKLLPMVQIRIRAIWGGTTYPLFRGFVERWRPNWPGGLDGTCRVECVDGFKVFAQLKISTAMGAKTSYQEIETVLLLANWPIALRDIDGLNWVTIVAITLSQTSGLSHMQEVEFTEGGQLWIAPDGDVTWRWRSARGSDSRSVNIQARFGYDPSPTVGWVLGDATYSVLGSTTILRDALFVIGTLNSIQEQRYLSVDMTMDDQDIVNDAQITASGGATYTASDSTSITRYGARTFTKTLLSSSAVDAQERADLLVANGKDAKIRITNLVFSGHQADEWMNVLYLEISDRVEVIIRPANSGTVGQTCLIESVEHRNITDSTWDTVLGLSLAEIY